MESYIKQLRKYITEHKIIFDEESAEPCLDSLWWHYGESHAMMNNVTQQRMRELYECLDELRFRDREAVISHVGSLCAEHERIAFVAGIRLGVQLIMEVIDAPR